MTVTLVQERHDLDPIETLRDPALHSYSCVVACARRAHGLMCPSACRLRVRQRESSEEGEAIRIEATMSMKLGAETIKRVERRWSASG